VPASPTKAQIYLIDTSVWVNFDAKHHLASVLKTLAPHAQQGRVKALDELKRRWPHIRKAIRKIDESVKASMELHPEVVKLAGELLHTYPFLGRALLPYNIADPWVIAAAEFHKWTVVSDDGAGRHPTRSLLGVCKKRTVRCLTREEFAAELGVDLDET
jgi:hypothetical protein